VSGGKRRFYEKKWVGAQLLMRLFGQAASPPLKSMIRGKERVEHSIQGITSGKR